jgi:hypothetical protein
LNRYWRVDDMRKNKARSARPKQAKKTSVKMKNLPAKSLESHEVMGGGALKRPDALNLGL